MTAAIPPPLRERLLISEIDDAKVLGAPIFRRKYGQEPPEVPHHLIALHRADDGVVRALGYSHLRRFGSVLLSGGSCTDGDAVRAIAVEDREAITAAGGVLSLILRHAFARFGAHCEAFFGHCGDARALEVCTAVGFVATGTPHLIVHWHRALPDPRRRALIDEVAAIGPF